MLLLTASNGESAKQVLLGDCRMFPGLIQRKWLILLEMEPLSPASFVATVMLPTDLLIDTNFCVSSTTYLSLHQQFSNAEHSEQFADFQNTDVVEAYVRGNLSRKFLLHVCYSWQPVDSYQLMQIINAKKRLLFRINFHDPLFIEFI